MYSGGSGTVFDPYLIATPEDFYNIRENLSAHFKQVADLDFSNFGEYEPPGNNFTGVYDGGNFSIKNANIKGGLFGTVRGGIIQNMKVENVNLTSIGDNTGVIARVIHNAIVQFCRAVGGNITANHGRTGGIAGHLSYNATIRFCWTNIKIESFDSWVGGIAGYAESSYGYANINDCYSLGDVLGDSSVGGIIGGGYGTGTGIRINRCYATGYIGGSENVAGIVGNGDAVFHVTNCYALNKGIIRSYGSDKNTFGRIVANSSRYRTLANNYALKNMKFYPAGL